jgi:hypothetical protein
VCAALEERWWMCRIWVAPAAPGECAGASVARGWGQRALFANVLVCVRACERACVRACARTRVCVCRRQSALCANVLMCVRACAGNNRYRLPIKNYVP